MSTRPRRIQQPSVDRGHLIFMLHLVETLESRMGIPVNDQIDVETASDVELHSWLSRHAKILERNLPTQYCVPESSIQELDKDELDALNRIWAERIDLKRARTRFEDWFVGRMSKQ